MAEKWKGSYLRRLERDFEKFSNENDELKISWATAEHQRATLQALLAELYDHGMISGLHDHDCKGAGACECEFARRLDAALFPRKDRDDG